MSAKAAPPTSLQHQLNSTENALREAAYAMNNGRPDDAERIAGAILKKTPGDARAAHIYGHSLHLQGRSEDAVAALQRAVQQNQNPILETQLGMLFRQTDRLDEALKMFERAVKRQPAFPPAFLEYGSLLAELMRYDEAINVLERGLALAPEFAEILVHLGSAYAARGNRDKAANLFSRAVTSLPDDRETLFNIAQLMKNSLCFALAADVFKRLLANDSNDVAARVGLGICLLEIGDQKSGFKNLSIASGINAHTFGQTLNELASAGKGRFWLKPSDARRFLESSER